MRPKLIHPQVITAQIPVASDAPDDAFREPIGRGGSRLQTITFKAQISFRSEGTGDGSTQEFGVLMGNARGYLIAHADSDARLMPKGAKLTAFNGVPCKWAVLRVDPAAFDRGYNMLLFIPFEEDNS